MTEEPAATEARQADAIAVRAAKHGLEVLVDSARGFGASVEAGLWTLHKIRSEASW